MPKSTTMRTVLLACMLFVVLVVLQHHKSFTADEVYELRNLSNNWGLVVARPDGFPPLYCWLLSQFVELASASNARLFSAITAVVGLFFVAAAGRRLGDGIGARAALFYAVSACQLEYAQQVRAYSLYICLGAIVIWSAVNTICCQRTRDWLMLVLSSVAILWVHYYAAPFLVAVWLGILILGWYGDDRSQQCSKRFITCYVLSTIGSLVLLIPWLYPLRIDLQNPPPIEAINAVDLTGIAYTYVTLIHGWCVGPSQLELFEWSKSQAVWAIAPWAILSAIMFLTVAYYACLGQRKVSDQGDPSSSIEPKRRTFVVSTWMAAMIITIPLGSAALALIANSSFVPRYLAVLVIPVSLLFGLGSQLDRLSWQSVASWGLVTMNVFSFAGRNFLDRYDRENYQELIAFLKVQDQSPQLLVLSRYLGHAIDYQKDDFLELEMVGLNSDEPDDWPDIQATISDEFGGSERFWIAADWMRTDDLRTARRDKILAALGARHVKRISGTLDLFLATQTK